MPGVDLELIYFKMSIPRCESIKTMAKYIDSNRELIYVSCNHFLQKQLFFMSSCDPCYTVCGWGASTLSSIVPQAIKGMF